MENTLKEKIENIMCNQKRIKSDKVTLNLTSNELKYVYLWIKTAYSYEYTLDEMLDLKQYENNIPKIDCKNIINNNVCKLDKCTCGYTNGICKDIFGKGEDMHCTDYISNKSFENSPMYYKRSIDNLINQAKDKGLEFEVVTTSSVYLSIKNPTTNEITTVILGNTLDGMPIA